MNRIKQIFGGCLHPLYALAAVFCGLVLYVSGGKALSAGFFAGAAVLLFFWLLRFTAKKWPKATRIVEKTAVYALLLFAMAFAATEVMLISDAQTSKDPKADYVIVLGAQVVGERPSGVLGDRLEAALAYLNTYPQAIAVVSGGQGPGERISEAQCMADWLTARGIAPERILLEDRSTRTAENILYAKAVIAAHAGGMNGVETAVLTSEFHLMRAKILAGWAGLGAKGVAAPSTNKAALVNNCFREAFAIWNSLLRDRVIVSARTA